MIINLIDPTGYKQQARAVEGPRIQLLLTGMFGVLVIYVFMAIAFFTLGSDLTNAGEYYGMLFPLSSFHTSSQ